MHLDGTQSISGDDERGPEIPRRTFTRPPTQKVVLGPRRAAPPPRQWGATERELIDAPAGAWRLTGTAGSGVSSLLLDTALARLEAGVDPSRVLIVAASKESGARLRRELTQRIDGSFVSGETLVRSLHSLAFALLRTHSDVDLRLLTGAEHDAIIQELLVGEAEDGGLGWPAEYRPALRSVGFARQLRDFLLRAAERGLGPDALEELGRQHNLPMWESAGRFLRDYERTAELPGHATHNFVAAELVAAAVGAGAHYRGGLDTLLVDDAQHLDPISGQLISSLMSQARKTVISGDPQQAVFHFRGATGDFLTETPVDYELVLTESRRSPERHVVVSSSQPGEAHFIISALRRAHLIDGVPWSDMGVIVRSSGLISTLRRHLLAGGVPVHLNPTDVVLAEQPMVANIVLGVRFLYDEQLSAQEFNQLLLGPVGGADPITLRRLLRGLRRYDMNTRASETLWSLLRSESALPEQLTTLLGERELAILARLRKVIEAGRGALAEGGTVEEVLWAVWSATELDGRLASASLRGGAAGSQADADLDAMMAFFDAAGDFAERRPSASLQSFVTFLTNQELPTGVRERRGTPPDAVSIVTAHGAVGQEWDTVVVAGVQDGVWPALGQTGSMFNQEDLIDLTDEDITPEILINRTVEKLAEERRLFNVATTRATRFLLVTAVESEVAELAESQFIDEFATAHGLAKEVPGRDVAREDESSAEPDTKPNTEPGTEAREARTVPTTQVALPRLLSQSALVAELRRVVTDPQAPDERTHEAARQLARLAKAGIPGADPLEWWSLTTPTSRDEETPQPGADQDSEAATVWLSPSQIEKLLACPMKAVLSGVVEEDETLSMIRGTLLHGYVEACSRGVPEHQAREIVTEAFLERVDGPLWEKELSAKAWENMLKNAQLWLAQTQKVREVVGLEVSVEVDVAPGVGIRGRIDRLDREHEREDVRIVDFKSGKTPPTKKKAEENPQLRAYQLALLGATKQGERYVTPRGDNASAADAAVAVESAVLVYPAKTVRKAAAEVAQARLTPELAEELARALPTLAARKQAQELLVTSSPDACTFCPLFSVCPLQEEGKVTTRAY